MQIKTLYEQIYQGLWPPLTTQGGKKAWKCRKVALTWVQLPNQGKHCSNNRNLKSITQGKKSWEVQRSGIPLTKKKREKKNQAFTFNAMEWEICQPEELFSLQPLTLITKLIMNSCSYQLINPQKFSLSSSRQKFHHVERLYYNH